MKVFETKRTAYDIAIIGGGLAGLMAAGHAELLGAGAVLVDAGIPNTARVLGGFAPFSGAKFSLFPAGSGIGPLVGGSDALIDRYRKLCQYFVKLGFPSFRVAEHDLAGDEHPVGPNLDYRRYHSILLSPAEVHEVLAALASRLERTRIIRANALRLDVTSGPPFRIVLDSGEAISCRALIVAAGRLGANLLKEAGVPEARGKGIDVGVRLGFSDRHPVAGLRRLGPDAKFMAEGVRTFCLNSPGRIFHYPGLGYSLPGGIVAEAGWPESNVGILCRLDDRKRVLDELSRHAPTGDHPPLRQRCRETDLNWSPDAMSMLGQDVTNRIGRFVERLTASGLITLPEAYDVHYPLLDWHWPVFSLPGRLGTKIAGVIAAGDASGHARGLMQASVMGPLAVEEALS